MYKFLKTSSNSSNLNFDEQTEVNDMEFISEEAEKSSNSNQKRDDNITSNPIEEKTANSAHDNNSWADIVANEQTSGKRPTPIQIKMCNPADSTKIINQIHGKFEGIGYTWRQLNPNASQRIFADDVSTKTKKMEFLDSIGIEYNTYAEKNSKRKAYIVRGLCHGNDRANIDGIINALDNFGITGDVTVNRFYTGHMKRNPDNCAMSYQIILGADVIDSNIGDIKVVNSFQIKIEKLKKSGVTQCKRCQRFQHTAGSSLYYCR